MKYISMHSIILYRVILLNMCVAEEQLELVSIVEVVQTNLSRNFTVLLSRISRQDQLLHKQQCAMSELQREQRQGLSGCSAAMQCRVEDLLSKLSVLQSRVMELQQHETHTGRQTESNTNSIVQLKEELFSTQSQFEDKMLEKRREMDGLGGQLERLHDEQRRVAEEMNNKESKVNVEQTIKDIEHLRAKNMHLESEMKLAIHKIETIEILSQKAEREKPKKDGQLSREIQERILKEVKNIVINTINAQVKLQQGTLALPNATPLPSIHRLEEVAEGHNEMNMGYFKINIETALEKCTERIKVLEIQVKESQENVKNMIKNTSTFKKNETKDSSSEGIKEKINQIKPEIIKLWAKIDTLEDRLSFNEKKVQDKLKLVNQLSNLIKENSNDKLEEKIKSLQSELYSSMKDLKVKIQTRVKQSDFDKQIMITTDKIQQIDEVLMLKSDKLEVKKALLFLESKIKEIILVISEDEENEKDALLTKKQLKCMSCDKQFDKFNGVISSPKGNWDCLPYKDHPPQILGRFGMTNFGSLSKKIKKLQSKDLPVLHRKLNVQNQSHNTSTHD